MLRINLINLPQDSSYSLIKITNAEVTTAGIQFGYYKSVECEMGRELIALGKIVEIYEYDTIWFKELIEPKVIQASSFENSFCQHNHTSFDGTIIVGVRGLYYRDIRYP